MGKQIGLLKQSKEMGAGGRTGTWVNISKYDLLLCEKTWRRNEKNQNPDPTPAVDQLCATLGKDLIYIILSFLTYKMKACGVELL